MRERRLVDKKTWVRFTRENLLRSSREREKTNKLHSEMDGYLRSSAVELYTAYNMVNHALATRVQETTDVKNKLQERLLRVRVDSNNNSRPRRCVICK